MLATDITDLTRLDIYSEEFKEDPYPFYARLRAEAPLIRLTHPDVWVMTRHKDVSEALRNPGLYSSAQGVAFRPGGGDGSLVAMDDPDHRRLRGVLSRQFTPRNVRALRDRVDGIVADLVSPMADGSAAAFDFVPAFADPLPTRVIAQYLGISPEDWRDYRRWSVALTAWPWARGDDPILTAEIGTAVTEAVTCFSAAVADRRVRPTSDLIGRMVSAADAEEALTEEEIVNFCSLLMIAGNTTTASVLAHAMHLLLAHPEQRRALRDRPEGIPQAVEEIIRFEPPIQCFARTLTADHRLHGQDMRAGDRVLLAFGAANRDETVFPDPDRFDTTRTPAGHIAFGSGPHFCLGAWLARTELESALTSLLPLMDDWAPDPHRPLVRRPELPSFRDITSLPLVRANA
ncbi:cytochrome P450 [Streptomyces sp. A1499]|uniref:cytochrome P450 n=1 Tax=Streptomyces sp. A1499 TaxID=2563104 RepID=UPI00144AE65A|nr:cytochrome P450 [Streptomyces sp. A1499]